MQERIITIICSEYTKNALRAGAAGCLFFWALQTGAADDGLGIHLTQSRVVVKDGKEIRLDADEVKPGDVSTGDVLVMSAETTEIAKTCGLKPEDVAKQHGLKQAA